MTWRAATGFEDRRSRSSGATSQQSGAFLSRGPAATMHSQRSDVGPITGRRADGKDKSSLTVLHREDEHECRLPVVTAEPQAPPQKGRQGLAGDAVRVRGQPLGEEDLRITSEDRAAGRCTGATRELGGFGAAELPGNVRTTFRRGRRARSRPSDAPQTAATAHTRRGRVGSGGLPTKRARAP